MYLVTKQFISGLMQGVTVTHTTSVQFAVGKTYTPCAGSSAYIVLSCVEA